MISRVNKDEEDDVNFTVEVRRIVTDLGSLTNTIREVSYVRFR